MQRIKLLISNFFKSYVCRMAFIGAFLKIGCDIAFDVCIKNDLGTTVIRHYARLVNGKYENFTYTIAELIYWIGEPLMQVFIYLALTRATNKVLLSDVIWRWLIDFAVVDILFLLLSTPYVFNRSKWLSIGLATVFFLAHTGFIIAKNKMVVIHNKNNNL